MSSQPSAGDSPYAYPPDPDVARSIKPAVVDAPVEHAAIPPAISFADLVRVATALNARGAELERIAAFLGFTGAPVEETRKAALPEGQPGRSGTSIGQLSPLPAPRRAPDAAPPPLPVPQEAVPAAADFLLQEHPPLPRPKPLSVGSIEDLLEEPPSVSLAEPTLFALRHQRSILTEAVAQWDPVGPPDVEAIVRDLARVRPVKELPRLAQRTQRRGVQVLLDVGPSMQPFLNDLRQIQSALHDTLGRDGIQELYFAGSPQNGAGSGPPPTWQPYAPPPSGIPIIIISDLGIASTSLEGASALLAAWEAFGSHAHAAGCPVTAWVPFPAERHPERLKAVMTLIPWQRSTTALSMRHFVDRAARRV